MARGWTALLLAAVFAVHGLQCTAAATDHPAEHGIAALAAIPVEPLDDGATSTGTDAHGATRGAFSAVAATAPLAGLLAADHGSAPTGAGGHLWALCLAVLAAGLALLLTLLPRLLAPLPAAWARLRTHASIGLAPLRPPDLHSLCLLRI
ncbi:DUF6153 family protein [Blastococcus sp. SYSU DS0533]